MHSRTTHIRRAIAVGAAVGLAAVAMATASGAASASPEEARELIIARDMDVNSLDPSRAYCDTCQIFLTAAYETLVTVDPADLAVQIPRLAETWEANEDQTVFTFNLNPAATFADGSPVEAKDVQWSWERLHNTKGSASYLMDGIESIETPDEQTVIATFARPELGVHGHRERAVHGHRQQRRGRGPGRLDRR